MLLHQLFFYIPLIVSTTFTEHLIYGRLQGNSLAVQWLEFCVLTAKGPSLILGGGVTMPQATPQGQGGGKKKKGFALLLEIK